MSINIKVALEQVWSINDLGFIELEVVTLPSLEDEVVGPLVLSPETILFKMNAEIKRCSEHDIQFDPSDWYRMAEKLEDIAYLIEQQIEALDD